MQQEQGKALEAIRNLIAYYTSGFKEGCGYTGKQLISLTRLQAEIALCYGVPIGVRETHFSLNGNLPEKPYRYITIRNVQALDQRLADPSVIPLATIHTDLPRQVQQILYGYILQIMEIECPENLPPPIQGDFRHGQVRWVRGGVFPAEIHGRCRPWLT